MSFRTGEEAFDAPIAGMSMTHELGARPWQQPAQYPTVEEALEFYVQRLTSDQFVARLLEIIERGIPLTALAETITLGGVMEGLHSVDVAVLVNPVLVELMAGIADNADVEYKVGDTDGEDVPDKGIVAKAMKEIRGKYSFDEDREPEQQVEEEETEEPRGLMARRGDR
jgi:hypothetical protein|tara:strand:- start:455 stop:961 length:507 start_codon:yes stop_codon:yes gene_type:complete